MSLQSTFIADLKSIATELGNQHFTWKGEDYECIAGTKSDIATLEVGGFSVDADLSITVLKELFTDGIYPTSQQKITHKSTTYRIHTVKQDPTDAFLRLICIDDSKGV